MKTVRRKGPLLVLGMLLVGSGIGMGALASSLTSSAVVWRAPPAIPVTAEPVQTAPDHAGAGRAWARSAFNGGLRECPKMNPEFLAACQAEMKALAERPDFAAGSYGGPLRVTEIEDAVPPPDFEPYIPEEPDLPDPALQADYDLDPPSPAIAPPLAPTPPNYPAELPGH